MIFALTHKTLVLALIISGIPLFACAVFGLCTSVLQAATSIQDQTISYVVKLVTLVAVFAICGEWFLTEVLELFKQTLMSIALIS